MHEYFHRSQESHLPRGLDRLPSIRASKSPGLGSLLFPPEERPLCLLCPWSDLGEGSSEGTKGVTQRPPHIARAKHCDVHLHAACSPALFAGSSWDLLHTEPSSSCPLPKCHLPPPAQTSHLIMEPFLFPQILEGSCYPEPCVQACPGGIYMSLEKGGYVTLTPMFKHPHL